MPLPASAPILLKTSGASTGIQDEFSAANLAAASTAAGLDPLPTSMLDFLGLSAYARTTLAWLTPGTYTTATNAAASACDVLVVAGGGGGGGAIAGPGYVGEPGGMGAAAGGGGGGGSVALRVGGTVTPGGTITVVVGAGGSGISGIVSTTVGPYAGTSGGISSLYFGAGSVGSDTSKYAYATGGLGGRTYNSNFKFTVGKLTNGSGGNSGSVTYYTPGYGYPVVTNSGGLADDSFVDWVGGGGGGGATSAGANGSTAGGAGGAGAGSFGITGIPNGPYGAGGSGGGAGGPSELKGNGSDGATYGNGGDGAASCQYTASVNPVLSYNGGNGHRGGVVIYY